MQQSPPGLPPVVSNIHLLLAYVADLELEVDQLAKQGQYVRQEVRQTLKRVHGLCHNEGPGGNAKAALAEVNQITTELATGSPRAGRAARVSSRP